MKFDLNESERRVGMIGPVFAAEGWGREIR